MEGDTLGEIDVDLKATIINNEPLDSAARSAGG